jgi:hypothetical protein
MADVASAIESWSTTASSNSPSDATTIGAGLADNFQQIQATVRTAFASKGADIASATTTDLGAVPGKQHDITGTTTITSFGTVAAGIEKVIKFEGVLTLTHNATSLILPGGGNITTADGDIAIMVSEGSGNWRCISYVGKSVFSANGLTWYYTAAGEIRMPLQPCFLAYNSASDADQTGDGTVYTVVCNTEVIDANADYDTGTGIFTAPVGGKYLLQFQVILSQLGTAHATHTLLIVTSNRTYTFEDNFASNPFGQRTLTCSVIADMDAADTATFQIQISGSTKTVDIFGGAAPFTYVSGMLVA